MHLHPLCLQVQKKDNYSILCPKVNPVQYNARDSSSDSNDICLMPLLWLARSPKTPRFHFRTRMSHLMLPVFRMAPLLVKSRSPTHKPPLVADTAIETPVLPKTTWRRYRFFLLTTGPFACCDSRTERDLPRDFDALSSATNARHVSDVLWYIKTTHRTRVSHPVSLFPPHASRKRGIRETHTAVSRSRTDS